MFSRQHHYSLSWKSFTHRSTANMLGLPWTPSLKIAFKQFHQTLSHCRHIPSMLLGGRYYLSTRFHNLTLYSPTSATHLSLTLLLIIHVPCNTSFQYQKGGLGTTCPKHLRFSFPVFRENHFTYIPWATTTETNVNISAPHIPLPSDFTVDNSTLVSLDNT